MTLSSSSFDNTNSPDDPTLPSSADVTTNDAAPSSRTQRRAARRDRRHSPRAVRRRRVIALTALVVAAPVAWSYGGYLRAPGNAPTTVRSVDWLRDHGFSTEVNGVEQWWYTRSKPTGTKVPADDLPTSLASAAGSPAGATATSPAGSITPVISPAVAGEGVWAPVTGLAVSPDAVQQTFVRPDPKFPSVAATVVRFDQHAVTSTYVPGTKEPGGSGWSWGSQIPLAARSTAVAAFNAGFKFSDTPGGAMTEGRTPVRPLENGLASIVVKTDGTIDVGDWGRDDTAGADVASVRQNLHLIVDGGQPVGGLANDRGSQWGTRRSQFQFTWRAGLGVDASGRLVYVVGHRMTLTELADSLTAAGAVRGMQLDIHGDTDSFIWYRPVAGTAHDVTSEKLIPSMPQSSERFLAPDQRDFIEIGAR